jgi:hypothetical protein
LLADFASGMAAIFQLLSELVIVVVKRLCANHCKINARP